MSRLEDAFMYVVANVVLWCTAPVVAFVVVGGLRPIRRRSNE